MTDSFSDLPIHSDWLTDSFTDTLWLTQWDSHTHWLIRWLWLAHWLTRCHLIKAFEIFTHWFIFNTIMYLRFFIFCHLGFFLFVICFWARWSIYTLSLSNPAINQFLLISGSGAEGCSIDESGVYSLTNPASCSADVPLLFIFAIKQFRDWTVYWRKPACVKWSWIPNKDTDLLWRKRPGWSRLTGFIPKYPFASFCSFTVQYKMHYSEETWWISCAASIPQCTLTHLPKGCTSAATDYP